MDGLVDGWVDMSNKQSGTSFSRPSCGSVSSISALSIICTWPAPSDKLRSQACQPNEAWGRGGPSENTQAEGQMWDHFKVSVRCTNGHLSHSPEKGPTRVVGPAESSLLSGLKLFVPPTSLPPVSEMKIEGHFAVKLCL